MSELYPDVNTRLAAESEFAVASFILSKLCGKTRMSLRGGGLAPQELSLLENENA